MPAGSGWEVSLPGKMLQLSGDYEDKKNMSAFIDGREEKNRIWSFCSESACCAAVVLVAEQLGSHTRDGVGWGTLLSFCIDLVFSSFL